MQYMKFQCLLKTSCYTAQRKWILSHLEGIILTPLSCAIAPRSTWATWASTQRRSRSTSSSASAARWRGWSWAWTSSRGLPVASASSSETKTTIDLYWKYLCRFYLREDAEAAVRFINGTRLDDRIIRWVRKVIGYPFSHFQNTSNLQDRLGCWFCGGQAVWSRQDWGPGGKNFVNENLWNIGCLWKYLDYWMAVKKMEY